MLNSGAGGCVHVAPLLPCSSPSSTTTATVDADDGPSCALGTTDGDGGLGTSSSLSSP
jgi:hypothetical protein